MHHITAIGADIERTDAFYSDLLGMQRVKKTSNFDDPNSAHWYWGVDERPPRHADHLLRARPAQGEPGGAHGRRARPTTSRWPCPTRHPARLARTLVAKAGRVSRR